jgi:hypothetical protein
VAKISRFVVGFLVFSPPCASQSPNHILCVAAFLGEPSGFFSNLHTPPYESLQFAFDPVGSLTNADQLCDAAEHLTIISNGAMIYCDLSVATEFSKKACEFMDRLVSEYPNRAMNDLVCLTIVARRGTQGKFSHLFLCISVLSNVLHKSHHRCLLLFVW